jgi:hypothetical protein
MRASCLTNLAIEGILAKHEHFRPLLGYAINPTERSASFISADAVITLLEHGAKPNKRSSLWEIYYLSRSPAAGGGEHKGPALDPHRPNSAKYCADEAGEYPITSFG